MLEPANAPEPSGRAQVVQPKARVGVIVVNAWRYDPNVSWYGPGFYGRRTACGLALTRELQGAAHRTLPCGTMVRFRNPANGITITVPVVDRGPYVAGRQWDLTGGACVALDHCYTGPLEWRFP
jgi:rare lipoprotein A (peptidoglycan hydrolase)